MPLSISTCWNCRSYGLVLLVLGASAVSRVLCVAAELSLRLCRVDWLELIVWLEGRALAGHYKTWSVWAQHQPACCNAHVSEFQQVWSASSRG